MKRDVPVTRLLWESRCTICQNIKSCGSSAELDNVHRTSVDKPADSNLVHPFCGKTIGHLVDESVLNCLPLCGKKVISLTIALSNCQCAVE